MSSNSLLEGVSETVGDNVWIDPQNLLSTHYSPEALDSAKEEAVNQLGRLMGAKRADGKYTYISFKVPVPTPDREEIPDFVHFAEQETESAHLALSGALTYEFKETISKSVVEALRPLQDEVLCCVRREPFEDLRVLTDTKWRQAVNSKRAKLKAAFLGAWALSVALSVFLMSFNTPVLLTVGALGLILLAIGLAFYFMDFKISDLIDKLAAQMALAKSQDCSAPFNKGRMWFEVRFDSEVLKDFQAKIARRHTRATD